MLKRFIYLCSVLSTPFCVSQEIVSSTHLNLKKNHDVFQIVNDDKKEITLFVSDKIKVKALLLNKKMELLDSISTERPNTKAYPDMIGYNENNNNAMLFWSSDDYEEILAQSYNFTNHTVTKQEFSLYLRSEKVLHQFTSNNKFYILTVLKNSNKLRLHVFEQDGNYEEKDVSLEGFHFLKFNGKKTNLYGVLGENLLPAEASFSLQNINVENPTSITEGAKKRKCYLNKNQLIITLDANADNTQILTINLENYTATEKLIIKPILAKQNRILLNSNSFYFDNKLYQITSSPDAFNFSIKDLDGTVLKEFTVTEDSPFDFKNSSIYQEGSDFGGKRILQNNSQFIKRIYQLNPGISCYHIGDKTLITLGSVSELNQKITAILVGPTSVGFAGGLIMGGLVAYYNSTLNNFNSYANRKVVKTECLFDKDNNHIKEEIQPLAFDKIRTFFDKNKEVSCQTLFKMDAYYLGYYDIKAKEYIIRKFVD